MYYHEMHPICLDFFNEAIIYILVPINFLYIDYVHANLKYVLTNLKALIILIKPIKLLATSSIFITLPIEILNVYFMFLKIIWENLQTPQGYTLVNLIKNTQEVTQMALYIKLITKL